MVKKLLTVIFIAISAIIFYDNIGRYEIYYTPFDRHIFSIQDEDKLYSNAEYNFSTDLKIMDGFFNNFPNDTYEINTQFKGLDYRMIVIDKETNLILSIGYTDRMACGHFIKFKNKLLPCDMKAINSVKIKVEKELNHKYWSKFRAWILNL